MEFKTVRQLGRLAPDRKPELDKVIRRIQGYAKKNDRYLAEEFIPLLRILIALADAEQYPEQVDQIWIDLFKGGAAFNRSHITKNLDPDNESFMKYLDIAIFAANPEVRKQVGL